SCVCQIGSTAHCVMNGFHDSRSRLPLPKFHKVIPNNSSLPEENHGRSIYMRNPPPKRTLRFKFVDVCRSHPKVGTTYSTRGAAGRAELGTSTVTASLLRVKSSGGLAFSEK